MSGSSFLDPQGIHPLASRWGVKWTRWISPVRWGTIVDVHVPFVGKKHVIGLVVGVQICRYVGLIILESVPCDPS